MLHDAPIAFQFPVSRSVRAGIFMGAVCMLAAAALIAWSLPIALTGFVWQQLLSLVAALWWAGACVQAYKQWRATLSGYLVWQAGAWSWQVTRASQIPLRISTLHCIWDGQGFLLLRVVLDRAAGARAHWLWLDQEMEPRLWADLRRAVVFWKYSAC